MSARPGEVLDARALQALLAHRYPFLLVDRIEIVEPGRHVRGTKRVTGAEWASGGPFLDAWTGGVPGVLVVEALAQASAALLVGLLDREAGAIGYFAGMERVRLRAPARPGDTLVLDVTLRSFRRSVAKLRGTATLDDGRVAATADFTTVVRPRET